MKLCVPHATFQSVKTFFRLKAHRKEKNAVLSGCWICPSTVRAIDRVRSEGTALNL